MKKIKYILLINFLSLFFAVKAQFIFTAGNTNPIIGDSYVTYEADTTGVNPGSSGAAQTWDFSNLNININQVISHYYLAPDVSVYGCDSTTVNLKDSSITYASNGFSSMFYQCTVDTFKSCGQSNVDNLLFVFPFSYGNSNQSNFLIKSPCYGSNPLYNDNGGGTKINTYDAYGTLILPGGVTYNNVVRTYSYSHYSIYGNDINIYYDDYGNSQTYNWYANGIKYPILTIYISNDTTNASGGHTGSSTNYYHNKSITVGGFNGIGIESFARNNNITIYPNPARTIINVALGIKSEAIEEIQVTDILGNLITKLIIKGSNSTFELDISSLQSGVSFLQVKTAKNNYITKFVKE